MRCHTALAALLLGTCLAIIPANSNLADTPDSTLAIPAYTAYFEPNAAPSGTEISPDDGVTGWSDPADKLVWYGHFAQSGEISPTLTLTLPAAEVCEMQLELAGQKNEGQVIGRGDGSPVTMMFGSIEIKKPGNYAITLTAASRSGKTFGDLKTLTLTGPAASGAHFSAAKNRAAPSVHLFYETPKGAKIAWFYNAVTAKADPTASYYMACGFSRGYFGMQVNSPTERRIIFSVWDSGDEPTDRSKVPLADQVQLVAKGPGVFAGSFGNEGIGGHSHLIYPWKTGETYQFLVSAQPENGTTLYSGYFWFPEKKAWGLIASFRAPKDGGELRGLYSFNEDFDGANGYQQRRAEFGPQWIRDDSGAWRELTQAHFSCTDNGKSTPGHPADRPDRSGGAIGARFYLENGGFSDQSAVKYWDLLTRKQSGKVPKSLDKLPLLPTVSKP